MCGTRTTFSSRSHPTVEASTTTRHSPLGPEPVLDPASCERSVRDTSIGSVPTHRRVHHAREPLRPLAPCQPGQSLCVASIGRQGQVVWPLATELIDADRPTIEVRRPGPPDAICGPVATETHRRDRSTLEVRRPGPPTAILPIGRRLPGVRTSATPLRHPLAQRGERWSLIVGACRSTESVDVNTAGASDRCMVEGTDGDAKGGTKGTASVEWWS